MSPKDDMALPTGEVEGGTSLGSAADPPRASVNE